MRVCVRAIIITALPLLTRKRPKQPFPMTWNRFFS